MMAEKEEGIVLSTVRYGDRGVVVNTLTRSSGRRGYMASAGRRGLGAAMSPLTFLEFVGKGRRAGQMWRMGDVRLARPFRSIPFDPVLRAEAFFVAELLCRAVPADVPDPELFDFVSGAVAALDSGLEGRCNFHLFFMMRLTELLGFAPDTSRRGMPTFDMAAGSWAASPPPHPDSVGGRLADLWEALSTVGLGDLAQVAMSRAERREMVRLMSRYYQLHQPGFSPLKSQDVLSQLI